MMRRLVEVAAGAAVICALLGAGPALAQAKQPNDSAAKPAAQAQPNAAAPAAAPAPGWVTRCSASSRQATLDCAVEENAVMNNTGQLVVGFSVRVPSDTRSPVVLVHLPLGLYLPAGLKLQVDDGQALSYPLDTCDASGCYVGMPLNAALLTQMKAGKQLKAVFQNLQRNELAVPLPLDGFNEAYGKIQ